MKNILALCFFFVATAVGYTQKQKGDTLVLSVYNHNARFMLTLADFGPDELNQSIMGEMVAIYDTLISIKGKVDTTKNKDKEPRFTITRACDKPLGDLKNKIAIIDLNKDCDVTKVCLNVQRAGAKAFIIVHNSNSNGNIKLPKKGIYKDSIRIPIFTIRQGLGERITSMLPSWVGISLRRLPAKVTTRATDLTLDVQALEEKARIMWAANTETTNQYFVVEKQNPITGAFEPLTTVLGQQGVEIGQYAIHDEKPFDGDNTYRIKMVMADGTIQFSDTRTIQFASSETVNIFPNPTADVLNVAIEGYKNQPIDISIFDIQGKVIHQQHLDSAPATTLGIPLSQKTTSGQYILRIRSAGKKDVMRRFTVIP